MKLVLKATPTRIFLYHGVKDPANVEKILHGGFDLTKLESNWINGYGIPTFSKAEAVKKWFRNPEIPIIQMTFDGNLVTPWEAEEIVAPKAHQSWGPRDYNNALVNGGVDAVMMESPFKGCKEILVHNLERVSNLKLVK